MVRDSSDPATRKRKWHVPALVGMNVLVKAGNVLGSLETVPSALQPALREARLEHTSVRGVARVASQSFIPARSLAAIRITGVQKPLRQLLASPVAQPLPGGLLLVPTLVNEDATQRCVRVANLSEEDYILPSRTPVEVLHAIDGAEWRRSTDHHSLQWDYHHRGALNSGGNGTWGCPLPCLRWDGWAASPPTGSTEQICSRIYKGRRWPRLHGCSEAPCSHDGRCSSGTALPLRPSKSASRSQGAHQRTASSEGHCRELQPLCSTRGFGTKKKMEAFDCAWTIEGWTLRLLVTRTHSPGSRSLHALVSAQYFSTLDLASGYYQTAMGPRDQHKTAFSTPFGLIQYTRMPMGLMSALATIPTVDACHDVGLHVSVSLGLSRWLRLLKEVHCGDHITSNVTLDWTVLCWGQSDIYQVCGCHFLHTPDAQILSSWLLVKGMCYLTDCVVSVICLHLFFIFHLETLDFGLNRQRLYWYCLHTLFYYCVDSFFW